MKDSSCSLDANTQFIESAGRRLAYRTLGEAGPWY